MVEYPVAEARDVLSHNLETANRNLKQVSEDILFLKKQITTTEVNVARVYNYDVKQRRQAKEAK